MQQFEDSEGELNNRIDADGNVNSYDGNRRGIGAGRKDGKQRRSGNPAVDEAQPATAEDMEAIMKSFSQASTASARPAQSVDEDWEQSWVQQLNDMRADQGGTSHE